MKLKHNVPLTTITVFYRLDNMVHLRFTRYESAYGSRVTWYKKRELDYVMHAYQKLYRKFGPPIVKTLMSGTTMHQWNVEKCYLT